MAFRALIIRTACFLFALAPTLHAQRKLQAGQVAQLRTIAIEGTASTLVFETPELIEAPNWTPDGKWLVCNTSDGLVKISADGSRQREKISIDPALNVNNDHVLSPDGRTVYVSVRDGHLYAVPIEGGKARRISNEHAAERHYRYYLHGISRDGQTLAYVGTETVGTDPFGRSDIYTIPAAGGRDVQLTDTPAPDDGPEYSPDGKWIYFNSELNAQREGQSQIYRMKPDGSGIEQLTHDERVNWFPHVSPDGKWIVYLSFPPGTIKHPADKNVVLRRMRPDGSAHEDIVACLGGQGTFNVNSWAPDSRRFAYVSYPLSNRSADTSELPPGWQHQDIGAASLPGTARADHGVFMLQGTRDIWGPSDGCHFVWQPIKGNATVVARVLSIERTHYHAKAGVAMRESLLGDGRHVTWVGTPADGLQLLVREQSAGATTSRKTAGVAPASLPVWLKLVREGDTFTTFQSADGKSWAQYDSFTLKLSETLYVGLVASSHQKDQASTATLDEVAVIRSGK